MIRTITDLVEMCENQLGYVLNAPKNAPPARQRQFEAGRIKKKMQEDPVLYTLTNLELALWWSWEKRLPIKSPLTLFYRIKWALDEAEDQSKAPRSITSVEKAVEWEQSHSDEESEAWIGRLMRSEGAGALETVDEWKKARRG